MQAHPGAVGLLAAHRRPQSAKRRKADGVGFGEADEDFGEVFGATDGAGADERLRRHRDVHQRPLQSPRRGSRTSRRLLRRRPISGGTRLLAQRPPASPAPAASRSSGRRCWSRWTAPAGGRRRPRRPLPCACRRRRARRSAPRRARPCAAPPGGYPRRSGAAACRGTPGTASGRRGPGGSGWPGARRRRCRSCPAAATHGGCRWRRRRRAGVAPPMPCRCWSAARHGR